MFLTRFILLFLASISLACASPGAFNFRFDKAPLAQVAKVVFGEVLSRSYILEDSITDKEVSIRLEQMPPEKILPVFRSYLAANGVFISEQQGVFFLTSGQKPDSFVYVPKNREASYISKVLRPYLQLLSRSAPVAAHVPGDIRPVTSPVTAEVVQEGQGGREEQKLESIVFSGFPAELEKIRSFLEKIDTPPGEVLVKASVFEVSTNAVESSAVDLVLGLIKSTKGAGLSIVQGADASNSLKLKLGDVSAVFSALSSDSRFSLLSSPVVRIRSGGRSRFVAGADVPVLGAVTYQGDKLVQSVEYRTSGVVLELSPVVREGVTDLSIVQQISQFVPTQNGVNSSPTLTKREVSTDVTVSGDELIILGGLDEVTNKTGGAGLSFLPAVFGSSRSESSRTELLILLNVQRI